MGIVAGTIGRTLAFWAVTFVCLWLMNAGGGGQMAGWIGVAALIGGPFLSYYRTMVVAREREKRDAELWAEAIAEGIRRARASGGSDPRATD